MVRTIAIELMTRLPEWEKQERLKFASEILQAIEIEGMLPPYNENHKFDNYELAMGVSNKSLHVWEPEDDPVCLPLVKNDEQ